MTRLSIGVMLSVLRATRPEDLRSNARHAEDLGLDALFVGDHLAAAAVPILDSTLTLAAVATVTERIRIGFGVMLPALRGPAWAAKQIATGQVTPAIDHTYPLSETAAAIRHMSDGHPGGKVVIAV